MLASGGTACALRAMREIDLGDVHDAVVMLGCYDAELRHREALETLAFAASPYEGWDEAAACCRALEALARRPQNLGL